MIVTLRGCASIAYPIYKHNAYIKVVVSCTNVINNSNHGLLGYGGTFLQILMTALGDSRH